MSNLRSRIVAILPALVVGLCLANETSAAPPAKQKTDDTLDRAGRLQTVQAQKAENDVRTAVLAAQQAKSTDKAVDILKRALAKLEDDQVLPESRRKKLSSMLEARIKAYLAGSDEKALTERDVERTTRRLEDNIKNEKKQEEQKRLQKALAEVLDLQKNGKIEEARRKSKELTKEFPGNPAVLATHTTMSSIDQLVATRNIKTSKERGFVGAMRDVEKSAIPISGDIEFSKDPEVIRRREMRAKTYGNKLSPKEQAIVRALNTPISVNFKGDRFQDVIEYLATVTNQPILLDKTDLQEAQIDYETPVNLSVKNVTVRTILRKILGEYGLTYIIKDETIQVVSQAKARETMTVRAYPVGDMLGVGGGPGDPLTNFFGPGIGAAQRMQNIANLISTIQSTVEPNSWQVNGGPGSVAFDFGTMSLIIKNSAEVHAMIGGGFAR
jgi:hypothetical protein